MSVIFNERGVADCKPPCVAQSFINHNAILYKLYVVGDHYQMVERPSLKNFYSSNGKIHCIISFYNFLICLSIIVFR